MKKATSTFLAFIFAIVLFSSGCGNDNSSSPSGNGGNQPASGTASFTLNGAGFSNKTYTISNVIGGFSITDSATGIAGGGATNPDTIGLTMAFQGSTTGTFQFNGDNGVMISKGQIALRGFVSGPGKGQIVVTAYGNVSGNITGTFSGTFYEQTSTGLDSVTVTNGAFSAYRTN